MGYEAYRNGDILSLLVTKYSIMDDYTLHYTYNLNLESGKRMDQKELIERLVAIRGMTSISVSINCEKTNVIMGTEIHTLWGKERITDTIFVRDVDNCFARTGDGIAFSISPLSFYQVNPVQTEVLYNTAMDYAELTGKETVIDAYCGTGTIGLIAAKNAKKVIGVELNKDAVKDARINAKENGITNAEIYAGDAGRFMVDMASKNQKADVVFMDPPRAGSSEEFLDAVAKIGPKRVVYVSCNPTTLERDCTYLEKQGYRAKEVWPVDMFPWSGAVEAVCLLEKNKKARIHE